MARATNTKLPTRKPGRPPGSANIKASARKGGAAAAPARATKAAAKPAGVLKATTRAVKPSKAELELHVGKLERSVAKLREKNRELKLSMTAVRDQVDLLETRLAAVPAADVAKPARRITRKMARPNSIDAPDDASSPS